MSYDHHVKKFRSVAILYRAFAARGFRRFVDEFYAANGGAFNVARFNERG